MRFKKWPRSGILPFADALKTEVKNRKCLFKKANLAIRSLSLIKGKEDIEKKFSDNLNQYIDARDLGIRI